MAGNIAHSSFWRGFNIGHALVIVVALLGFGRLQQRLDDVEKAQTTQASQISRMDQDGTRQGHENQQVQQLEIDQLARRLDTHDSIFRDLIPKVERIDANLLTLMSRGKK